MPRYKADSEEAGISYKKEHAGSHREEFSQEYSRSRRSALTRMASIGSATALGVAVGPWIVRRSALASSGEINVLVWENYLPESWRQSFTEKTGIVVNVTGISSNQEILNKMNATRGQGIDLCAPTSYRSGHWADMDLLSPWDLSKINNIENIYSSMLDVANTAWNFDDAGPHWLPHVWTAEGVGWRTDSYSPPPGVPSFGNIWAGDKSAGKAMIRAHSGMMGAGLYMETIGELEEGAVFAAYDSEDQMRAVWDKITAFCVGRRQRIARLWDKNREQRDGFLDGSIVVGQMSDSPLFRLKKEQEPVEFKAPAEGALTMIDGFSLSQQAQNVDQAYEFIKYCYEPGPAGAAIADHGINSAVRGAVDFADDHYKSCFLTAFGGDSIAQLRYLPFEPQWYLDMRTDYSNQLERLFVDA